MPIFKTFALASIIALSGLLVSAAHADTVGCYKYKSHETHKAAHWEKVVKDLKVWTAQHPRHHPYYHTMQRKLVKAEKSWKVSKQTNHHWKKKKKHHKHHHHCKVDVSPS